MYEDKTSKYQIVLATKNCEYVALFDSLCKAKNYQLVKVCASLTELNYLLNTSTYDIVVVDELLEDRSSVVYFEKNELKTKNDIPVLFIVNEDFVPKENAYINQLMVDLLYENLLSIQYLHYTIAAFIQKHNLFHTMKTNKSRYKFLYEHSFDISVILDNQYVIKELNLTGKKHLGNPSCLDDLFCDKNDFTTFKKELSKTNKITKFETNILFDDKRQICLIDGFTLLDSNGNVSGHHIVIKNIDKERKVSKIANRTNKLLVTGKFIRSLAHEIRNPLTNIQLALGQFKEDVALEEDDEIYINIVERSTSRIKVLLDEIMSAYKTAEVVLSTQSLNAIALNALKLAEDRFKLKKIKIVERFFLGDDLIQADFDKLSMALLNLLVNAAEATEKNGIITLLTQKNSQNQNEIIIMDTGVGMNKTQLDALFDPFYTGKAKGLGLGLTTTQNIVFAHNATIDVESTEGFGTTFIITWPNS